MGYARLHLVQSRRGVERGYGSADERSSPGQGVTGPARTARCTADEEASRDSGRWSVDEPETADVRNDPLIQSAQESPDNGGRMDQEDLFTHTQDLFRAGLVTLVGSGASAALGLPTMQQLADHVVSEVEKSSLIETLGAAGVAEWDRISSALREGKGLEAAIQAERMPEALGTAISQHVANAVEKAESAAINLIMQSPTPGPFVALVKHLFRVDPQPSIITTNYDRLIEVDLAMNGIVVDSMFVGPTIGHLDQNSSNQEHERLERMPGRSTKSRRTTRQHVRLSKPHGSLDWLEVGGAVVKTDIPTVAPRRVIAPGGSKYRLGYESPFDEHRARANATIERASAFLVVGYGFNDDHLETRLRSRFPGTPALVIARHLTPHARAILATNPSAVGVEIGDSDSTCRVISAKGENELDGQYWQLAELLRKTIP